MILDQLQTQLETTLQHLVRIPSIPADPQACYEIIEYIRDELAPYNLHIRGDFEANNPWLLATTQDTNEPDILLAAHLDVVPADYYRLENKDGKLYGRGTYDMKFAAACYLQFLRLHAEELARLNIGLLFTTDEERDSASMPDVLATGLRPKVVFLPDGGDNWKPEQRAKGFHDVMLTVQGKTAHGSRPWEGDNALHTLMDILNQLRAHYPSDSKSGATLAVNWLRAGQAHNQIPDNAQASIDFRSFDRQDIDDLQVTLNALINKYNLTITPINTSPPVAFDNTSPAVQSFLQVLRRELAVEELAYSDAFGGTDARFFAKYNIPCIIVEPHGGNRHADNEWLLASDLEKFYQLIERWLLQR